MKVSSSLGMHFILRQELNKRGIGADILEKIEHDIILQACIDKQKAIENINKNLY